MRKYLTSFAAMIVACAGPVLADSVTCVVSSGGGRSAGATAVNDGCIGGIGGLAAAGEQIVRHGYSGRLTDVRSLAVTGAPAQVHETATAQLSGTAVMSDNTVTALSGSEIS